MHAHARSHMHMHAHSHMHLHLSFLYFIFYRPSRFFDQWDPAKLPVAKHSLASPGIPNVALIHDFPVVLANGSNYTWQPKGPALPKDVAQLLRQAYYSAVSFVDEQVGKLVDALDVLSLADNTVRKLSFLFLCFFVCFFFLTETQEGADWRC